MRTGAELLFSLYFRQTFFVTRLIINQINKVQLVDFKLENVLVSLHSLKIMKSLDNRFTSQVDFNVE